MVERTAPARHFFVYFSEETLHSLRYRIAEIILVTADMRPWRQMSLFVANIFNAYQINIEHFHFAYASQPSAASYVFIYIMRINYNYIVT